MQLMSAVNGISNEVFAQCRCCLDDCKYKILMSCWCSNGLVFINALARAFLAYTVLSGYLYNRYN